MRSPSALAFGSLVVPAAIALCVAVAPALAQDDAGKEARLAAVEGNFDAVEKLLEKAPEEVQKDAALHLFIADSAQKSTLGRNGEEKRAGLMAARNHFVRAFELKSDESRAAVSAIAICQELADLDAAANQPDQEKAQLKYAFEFGEKAIAGGVATPDFKIQLGRMYGRRAGYVKSMNEVAQLVDDSTKGASLLAEASVGNPEPGKLLSEGSLIRLRAARLIHNGIPLDSETRDDEAMTAAIELAKKACEQPGASERDYSAHLNALNLAHSWGLKLQEKPFMYPLSPTYSSLKLQIPRAGGWTREKANSDFDIIFNRNLNDASNPGTVQVLIKQYKATDASLGGRWGQLKDMADRRFEKYSTSDLESTAGAIEPFQLPAANELWHYAVSGNSTTAAGRVLRIAEFIFFGDRKKDSVFQIKILDWRRAPDVTEPDIAAFVSSAIGDGIWPEGASSPSSGSSAGSDDAGKDKGKGKAKPGGKKK